MEPRLAPRGLDQVVADGAACGLIAGGATGLIDAVWSWSPAAQFVPGIVGRLRFVLFTGASYALAGVIAGVALAAALPTGRALSWPDAPLAALAAIVAIAIAAWANLEWETAKVLPLRAPFAI